MIDTAIETGFTSELTLKRSKELDYLLNILQKKYKTQYKKSKVHV